MPVLSSLTAAFTLPSDANAVKDIAITRHNASTSDRKRFIALLFFITFPPYIRFPPFIKIRAHLIIKFVIIS